MVFPFWGVMVSDCFVIWGGRLITSKQAVFNTIRLKRPTTYMVVGRFLTCWFEISISLLFYCLPALMAAIAAFKASSSERMAEIVSS
jgi:hypothetical protein